MLAKINLFSAAKALFIAFYLAFCAPSIADEISVICPSGDCIGISTPYALIENNEVDFAINRVWLSGAVGDFINYGTVIKGGPNNALAIVSSNGNDGSLINFINYGDFALNIYSRGNGNIENIINYGKITGNIELRNNSANGTDIYLANYDTITGSITNSSSNAARNIILDNQGLINGTFKGKFLLRNYALNITQKASEFNAFSGGNSSSHIVLNGANLSFENANSKIILRFSGDFELDEFYMIDKIITNTNGGRAEILLDGAVLSNEQLFTHLVAPGSIYELGYSDAQGGSFYLSVRDIAENSTVAQNTKANLGAISTLLHNSNALLFGRLNPTNFAAKIQPKKTMNSSKNLSKNSSSAKNSSKNTPKKSSSKSAKNSSRNSHKNSSKNSAKNAKNPNPRCFSQDKSTKRNSTQMRDFRECMSAITYFAQAPRPIANYDDSVIFAPFVAYDTSSEGLMMRGLTYGFVGAYSKGFSGGTFGFQLGVSVGEFDDKNADTLNLKNTNLMLGLHFAGDKNDDFYITARADGFYFISEINSYFASAKPRNYAAGLIFDVNKNFTLTNSSEFGVLLGLDGRIFQQNEINLENVLMQEASEIYEKTLLKMLFVDVGANFRVDFDKLNLGLNLGAKYNVLGENTAQVAINSALYEYSIHEKYYAYAGLSFSYTLFNSANLGLRYNANLGEKTMQHSGFLELEFWW